MIGNLKTPWKWIHIASTESLQHWRDILEGKRLVVPAEIRNTIRFFVDKCHGSWFGQDIIAKTYKDSRYPGNSIASHVPSASWQDKQEDAIVDPDKFNAFLDHQISQARYLITYLEQVKTQAQLPIMDFYPSKED